MHNRPLAITIRCLALITGVLAARWSFEALLCAELVRSTETQIARYEGLPPDRTIRAARMALARLEKLEACCQSDVDLHIALASLEATLGRPDAALKHLDDGLRADDRPEIYFNKGLTLLELGRIDEAVGQFAVACEFNMRLLEKLEGNLRERVFAEATRLQRIHQGVPARQ